MGNHFAGKWIDYVKFYIIKRKNYATGNFTRLNPNPRPAPWRTDDPIEGMNTSKMLNVAAAVNAIMTISSTLSAFLGTRTATMATTRPSTRYLIARLISSLKSKTLLIRIYYTKTKKIKMVQFIRIFNGLNINTIVQKYI